MPCNLTPVWPSLSSLLLWKQGRSRWSHWLASSRSRGVSGWGAVEKVVSLHSHQRRVYGNNLPAVICPRFRSKETDGGVFSSPGPRGEEVQRRIIQRLSLNGNESVGEQKWYLCFLEENICWLLTLAVRGIFSAVVFCVKTDIFYKGFGRRCIL